MPAQIRDEPAQALRTASSQSVAREKLDSPQALTDCTTSPELRARRLRHSLARAVPSCNERLVPRAGDFSAVPRSAAPRTLAMEPWGVVEMRLI